MSGVNRGAAGIEFRNVSKTYGSAVAVREVSFTVERGTLVTLLGPSGCGKTTTLRLIAGLETASAGAIVIGDTDVTSRPASERDVSMVFQSYALFPHMTVIENVAFGPTVAGLTVKQATDSARESIELVGLAGLGERYPHELSGGQQQRVAVARALVVRPSVLLFDEPLSNLDAALRRHMREEIRDLQRRLALTVVYVTHDQSEALAVSDRIIVMNGGRIAQSGPPRELYETPDDTFVATFMGEANLIKGHLRRLDDERAEVEVASQRLVLAHRGAAEGEVNLAVRPQAIRLCIEGSGATGVPGVIAKAAYLGGQMEYWVKCELGELLVIAAAGAEPFASGARVQLSLAQHGIAVLRR
jgi:iron(III) transport system ATP-binding protein